MAFPHWLRRTWRRPDVPAEVYISLVDSLFSEGRSLFIGAISASAAALLTAWKSNDWAIMLCAVGLAAVGSLRTLDMRAYFRQHARPKDVDKALARTHAWELRYIAGASAYVLLLGIWCLLAFVQTTDSFVRLLSFSVTLGYMVGVAGRNFGNNSLVTTQIVSAGVPMIAGLLLTGDPYYIFLALLLIPFFTSLKFISMRLHRTLLDAVIAGREMSLLASQFDTALNNMPHGLCMLDGERRLLVTNARLFELLGLAPDIDRRRMTVDELLQECLRAGTVTAGALKRFARDFEERLASRNSSKLQVEPPDGRTLDLTLQPMESGGSVVLVEDITERRFAEAKIRHLARYDAVTGLPNRAFFREEMDQRLAAVRRSDDLCAVLFVDLDQFKQVNDTLGHPCGDRLLCVVSDRLRRIVRQSDVLARFGGDEFIILQSPVKQITDTAFLAERIVKLLGEPYEIEGHEVVIGASVGIAMAPGDGVDADRLLKNADMALYRAKSDGRGGWCFFEPDMDIKAQARRALELDLRTALANDSFEVFYQPLLNLKTKRISSCEALLRWPHPERGLISPAEFIPVAEEMGLIVDIGEQVVRKVCAECMRWPGEVSAAVNISPTQFRRGNLIAMIKRALAESGLPAERLEIEITESVLFQDVHETRTKLNELRELGVRISLDDFGTGYSSLSYLHSFPFDKVKIDRSFLDGLGTSGRTLTLLRGVARLSNDLGLSVVVEGIETEEQLSLIAREDSVDEAQGYLFSAAIPARQIRQLLAAMYGDGAKPPHGHRSLALPLSDAIGWQ